MPNTVKEAAGKSTSVPFPMIQDEKQRVLRIDLSVLLSQLDKSGISNIRKKFVKGKSYFVDAKANPMAASFLDLLCQPGIFDRLTPVGFSRILVAIFPDWILDIKWLPKYCDILIHSLDAVKTKTHTDNRANAYYVYLKDKRIPQLKKQLLEAKEPFDAITPMLDVYKVVVSLFSYYAVEGESFTTKVTHARMHKLERSLRKVTVLLDNGKEAQKGFFNINIDPYKPEERQYAIFLSWLFTEMLCVQEGIETEAV